MPPTTIRSAPALDSFTSLEDHQSQTPASFYEAKPVLHHHIVGAGVLIASDQKLKLPIFHPASSTISGAAHNNDGFLGMGDVVVDVYVNSEQVSFTQMTGTSSCYVVYLSSDVF